MSNKELKEHAIELRKEKQELELKDKGEYFGGPKFTEKDRQRYLRIVEELKELRILYPYS